MARIEKYQVKSHNIIAFLDMIAQSEIGNQMLSDSRTDDGYKVLVGSMPNKLSLFEDYSEHPLLNKPAIHVSGNLYSSAAGRYQILTRYWLHYEKQLGLPDFGPVSQDRYSLQQIKEQRAMDDIVAGRIESAVAKCNNIWASLSGAGYGQHTHKMDYLVEAYKKSGGKMA